MKIFAKSKSDFVKKNYFYSNKLFKSKIFFYE